LGCWCRSWRVSNPKKQERAIGVSEAIADLLGKLGIPFELWTILLGLGGIVLCLAALKYLRMILVAKMQIGFAVWIKSRYMWNLLHTDVSYFHRQKVGVMTDTLTTQSNTATATVQVITEMITNIGVGSAYLLAAFLIAPDLAGAAIATMALVSLAMHFHIKRSRVAGAELVQRENAFQVSALESLSGIHVVKNFLLEQLRWKDFNDRAVEVGETTFQINRDRSQITILQEIILFGLIGGIVFVGVSILELDLAVVVALLFILYRLAPRVSAMNAGRQGLASTAGALHSVKMALDATSSPTIISGEIPFTQVQNGIELNGVNFSYDSGNKVLRDTSFSMEKGKMTAIVGPSGEGKTTIVDLILRNYDPTEGSILVDGVDLKEFDLPSWRKTIGVVSQDVYLFNDTIFNNISLWRPGVTEEDIENAAMQTFAHDFIQRMPQGYETPIGDRGWNLSGGQRQRLALARAILMKPEILILDEATSSLDSESERLVQEYMNRIQGTCTLIVVAHRLSTIRSADKIVVLQDGKIVEQGDWDTLLEESGVLANYHALQSSI
jgi:subfamily B ATP-binding cassette protein MsbA